FREREQPHRRLASWPFQSSHIEGCDFGQHAIRVDRFQFFQKNFPFIEINIILLILNAFVFSRKILFPSDGIFFYPGAMDTPERRQRGRPRAFKPQPEPGSVQSLDRALHILAVVAEENGLSLSEIAAKSSVPASTAYRMLTTL